LAGFTRGRRRLRRLGALSLTTLAVSALLTDPSSADPSPSARDLARSREQVSDRAADVGRINAELAKANAELDDMNDQAELAVERFNGARARLEQAERDYRAALARSARARDRLDQARRDLAVFASKAYRTDNSIPSAAAVLGGRGGPQGFLERAAFMQFLANRRHVAVEREEATRTIADLFEKQSRRALDAQRDATRATAAAREVATTAVARQRSNVQRIQRRKEACSPRSAGHGPTPPSSGANTPRAPPARARPRPCRGTPVRPPGPYAARRPAPWPRARRCGGSARPTPGEAETRPGPRSASPRARTPSASTARGW
jgi:hypothetical protein